MFLDEPAIVLIGDEQETQLAMPQASVNVSRGQRKLEEGRREALNNSIVREFRYDLGSAWQILAICDNL